MKNALTLFASALAVTAILATPAAALQVKTSSANTIIIKHAKYEKSNASMRATEHCSQNAKTGVLVSREVVFLAYLSTYTCQ